MKTQFIDFEQVNEHNDIDHEKIIGNKEFNYSIISRLATHLFKDLKIKISKLIIDLNSKSPENYMYSQNKKHSRVVLLVIDEISNFDKNDKKHTQ